MSKLIQEPKLRFKKFSNKWNLKKLRDISEIITGTTPSTFNSEYYDNGSLHFVSPVDISGNRYIYKTNTNLTELGLSKTRKIPSESVLFVCIGSTIGKVAQTTQECATNQQINALIANEENSNDFIFSLLENQASKISLLAGNQAVPQINKTDFSNFKFFFPSLLEQQEIASFLSSVDKKIELLQQKKILLEEYKKGVMQKIFNQELRFKDDFGNDYPDWKGKKLGEIGEIINGLTYSPNDIDESGVLVLRSSNVQDRILSFKDNVYVNVKEGKYNPVKENDILICVRNGSKRLIGKNAIIDKEREGLAFGAFMAIYRSTYNKFLFHFFDTDFYKKQVHRNLGATINSINGSDLKKFKVPFPSIEEQTKIAIFLTAIDAKIQLVNTQLEKTKEFKKGLLQQMFV